MSKHAEEPAAAAPAPEAPAADAEPEGLGRAGISAMLERLKGESMPRYRSGEEIGKGGHGRVTVAFDTNLGRRVALKRLRKGLKASSREVARFLEEVQITGQLELLNMVRVLELGLEEDGEVYFTM